MNNIEQFYEKIFKKVLDLAEKKEYDKAILMLEEELEAPYIPLEFYEKFEEKLLELKYEKNYFNDHHKLKDLDKNKFLNNFNNDVDTSKIIYFFDKFKETFLMDEKNKLYNILENKDIDNNKKIVILENLKQMDKEREVIYFNKNTHRLTKFNISDINFIEGIDFFKEVQKIINDIITQEPTLLELSFTIIYSFYEYYFPNFDFKYSAKEFSLCVVNNMENILKGTPLKDSQANADLKKVINNIQ
ncbi:MAG: DUF3196 family protein [Mycoplasmoidaceae bacterium]